MINCVGEWFSGLQSNAIEIWLVPNHEGSDVRLACVQSRACFYGI